jgi:hypothetical protein
MAKPQNSMANLEHWNVVSDFTGGEVTALVLGNDPSNANCPVSEGTPLYRKLDIAYNASRRWHALDDSALVLWEEIGVSRKEELLQSIGVGQALLHFDPDDSENLARWLASDEHSGFSTQRFARAEVARWLTVCEIPSVYKFTDSKFSKAESLSQKERHTMLKLIVAMAIRGYKYDPDSTNNGKAIGEIQEDLDIKGIPLSDDTIRNYLKEAVATVLPGK